MRSFLDQMQCYQEDTPEWAVAAVNACRSRLACTACRTNEPLPPRMEARMAAELEVTLIIAAVHASDWDGAALPKQYDMFCCCAGCQALRAETPGWMGCPRKLLRMTERILEASRGATDDERKMVENFGRYVRHVASVASQPAPDASTSPYSAAIGLFAAFVFGLFAVLTITAVTSDVD